MVLPFAPEVTYSFTAGSVHSEVVVKVGGEQRQIRIATPVGSDMIYIRFDGQAATTSDMPIFGGVVELFTMLANQTTISVLRSSINDVTGWATVGQGE